MEQCLFCKILRREEEGFIVFENAFVSCFLDKFPINRGHILVVPKKHFREFADGDAESLMQAILAAQKVAKVLEKALKTAGITIMQNNGIFKDVDHYHIHVITRWENDGFSWVEPDVQVGINELAELGELLAEEIKK